MMAFENRVENTSSATAHYHDAWADAAASAYQPGQGSLASGRSAANAIQEAGLGRPVACNPSLPMISHQEFLNQLGIPKGNNTSEVLVPPKGWDASKPNAPYQEWNRPGEPPHPITQPCEGEPLVS